MKNINVKKIVAGAAALALGVGVLGAAIAANNSGTTFGSVAKTDIYNTTTMVPKVHLVTGVAGQVSDTTWAQGIAAAIADNAKRENPDYASWVPSDGDEELAGENVIFDDTALIGAFDETIDDADYSLLFDEDVSIDDDETNVVDDEINVEDSLQVKATLNYDDDEDVQALTATINKGDIIYTIEFDDGIPYGYDGSGTPKFKFHFMGKEYQVDELNTAGTQLKLVESQGTTSYLEGATFSPQDGYIIEVTNILEVESDEPREVLLTLKDSDGTVIASDTFEAGDSDIFEDFIDATVDIDTVYTTQVKFFTGSSTRLELNNGDEIEDFPTKDDELWKVTLAQGDTNYLGSITVTNNHKDVEWKDAKALKIGDEIELPNNFAKIKYLGLTEEPTVPFTIEDGIITYTDDDEEEHSLFIYNYETGSDITEYETDDEIDGHTLYFEIDGTNQTVAPSTATAAVTIQLDSEDGDYLQADGSWDDTEVTWYVDGDSMSTTIDSNTSADADGWYTFSFDSPNNDEETLTYGLFLTEAANKVTHVAVGLGADAGDDTAKYKIYAGDNTVYWVLSGIAYDVSSAYDDDYATGFAGAKTNTATIVEDDLESVIEFTINDGTNTKIYVDPYTGALVDPEDQDYDATSIQVDGDNADLSNDTDDLTEAYTDFGSFFKVDGGMFAMDIPEDQINAKISIGAGTVTTGGTEENPYDQYIMTAVDEEALVVTDAVNVADTAIVVGGHIVNNLAVGVTENYLTQTGDHVMGKYGGKIFVAGYTAADTGTAAQALIDAINSW